LPKRYRPGRTCCALSGETHRFGALALAVVDTAYAEDGTSLQVDGRRVTVRPLPIDDPEKERPRA